MQMYRLHAGMYMQVLIVLKIEMKQKKNAVLQKYITCSTWLNFLF